MAQANEQKDAKQEPSADTQTAKDTETTDTATTNTVYVDPQLVQRQQAHRTSQEAADNPNNETVSGGRYKVGDKWVDANGQPVKDA